MGTVGHYVVLSDATMHKLSDSGVTPSLVAAAAVLVIVLCVLAALRDWRK